MSIKIINNENEISEKWRSLNDISLLVNKVSEFERLYNVNVIYDFQLQQKLNQISTYGQENDQLENELNIS